MLKAKSVRAVLLALSIAVVGAGAADPARYLNPRDFALMPWDSSPSDPAQLQMMKDAGLNISGFCAPKDLPAVLAAGMTCFVSDPRVNGYDWTKLPPDAELRASVAAAAGEAANNPAALGFFLRDEPDATMLPGLGRVAKLLVEALPDRWPYVNLFPTYASTTQLATPDYETYLRQFVQNVRPPFISWDNYSVVGGEMLDRFYTNLELVRRQSLESKIPFWNIILSETLFNYMEPSDATFNLQAYSTLAYGGRGIEYFTYFAPREDNFRLAPVDQFGNRTATWDMLRRINNQIQALAPTLVRLHSTGVYHSADVPPQGHPLTESQLVQGVRASTSDLQHPTPCHFLLGEFADAQGRPYLMLVNKDLDQSFHFRIQLKQAGKKLIWVSQYTGEESGETPAGWLAPGGGILLRVE
jgi:hypothetical protein